jgi:parallel beta-helix repeat protein
MKKLFITVKSNGDVFLIKALLFIGLTFVAAPVYAADVYLSTTGTKTSGKSISGDWSNANCYNHLQPAMAALSTGDTLTIADGTYSAATDRIDQNNRPPSGPGTGVGDARFTIIRAKNIPGLNGYPIARPLAVQLTNGLYVTGTGTGASTYVKFWGLRIGDAATYTGWDHLYFKQCAFIGMLNDPGSGDTQAFSGSGKYNIVEDCVAYGKGRYKIGFYDYSRTGVVGNNVVRRTVARMDFAMRETDPPQPIATFCSYYNRGTSFLNVIDVDSDATTFWKSSPEELAGSFYQPVDSGAHKMTVEGSVSVNSALGMGFTEGTGDVFTDVAFVKNGGGLYCKLGCTIADLLVSDQNVANFPYTSGQRNALVTIDLTVGGYQNNAAVTNSIVRDATNTGSTIMTHATGSFLSTYSLGLPLGITAANSVTSDPLTDGLLYPVRVESGSRLSTAGNGGGQLGPNVINILGKDGVFKGELDWNTPQGSLWPYPLEDWVKSEMASMPATISGNAMPSATRGFASPTAKRLDGVNPVTLTSYIWESLGNPIPADMYNSDTTPDVAAPVVSAFSIPTTSSSLIVAVNSFTATDDTAVTGYMITESAIAPTAGATGWSAAAPTKFTFSGTGDRTAYAWAKDAAGNISKALPASVNIAADTVAPSVAVTSPANASTVSANATLSAVASDNVGVTKVEYYINGSIYGVVGSSPYNVTWNTASLANGTCTLTAKAYDASGNVAQSSPVSVTVNNGVADTTVPVVSAFTLPATATSLAVTVSSLTATDNVAVAGYLINESVTAPAAGAAGWSSTKPSSFTFAGTGARTAYAWVKDAAGNVSKGVSAGVSITVAAASGKSYYLSPTGSDTNSCSAASPCKTLAKPVSLAIAGDTILLADGTYPGITIDGLVNKNFNGTATAPITIKAQGSNAVIAGRDSSVARGNLCLVNTAYIVVDGLKSTGATGSMGTGIAARYSNHITIKNGTYYDNSWINIFTSNVPGLVIENNTTYGAKIQHGIYVSNATTSHDQPIIRNNKTYSNAENGIHVNGDGGYYTGAVIENNQAYNNGLTGINMDGVRDSILRNNLIYGNHANGITMYMIDATAGPSGMQVYNNTIDVASDGRWCLRITNTAGAITVKNNVLYSRNSSTGAFSLTTASDLANLVSDYNVLLGAGGRVATPDYDSSFYTFSQWQAKGKDTHSLSPSIGSLFVALGSNYHLAVGSPAIDKGITLGNVTTDMEEKARPQGTSSDIGAYESTAIAAGTAPVVTAFAIPATSTTLSVPVTAFNAIDDAGVTGYLITEGATAPAATATGWSAAAPVSYTFAGSGARTAYAWAKDASGNVSLSRSASVTITLPDTTLPTIKILTPAGGSTVGASAVISTTASDNVKVTALKIYVDGSLKASATTGSLSWTWNTSTYAAGSHKIKVTAADAANNVKTKTITVYN